MNAVLPDAWAERLHRLAVGFEPVDPIAGGRVPHPVRFEVEGSVPRPATRSGPYRGTVRPGQPRPVVDRHDSCLFALLYQPGLDGETVDLRIYDPGRRRVPRRFRVPLLPPASLEGGEPAALTRGRRVRRPALFPGAACDLSSRVTGLRGRAMRDGEPLRWARVEARLEGGALVGRAHGDDRGEFVLVLANDAAPPAELSDPLEARVTVFAPEIAPVPVPATLPADDPLWDLPLEPLPAPGDPDPVSSGEALPATYAATASSTRIVPFRLGRLISAPDFVFA